MLIAVATTGPIALALLPYPRQRIHADVVKLLASLADKKLLEL